MPNSVPPRPPTCRGAVIWAVLALGVACAPGADVAVPPSASRGGTSDGASIAGTAAPPPSENAAIATTRPPATLPPPAPIDWTACGPARCGRLSVPLDYGDPGSEAIELDVIHVPALNPAGSLGALFVNPGGPGGSAVAFARGIAEMFTDEFDVYAYDPRGVSGTHMLTCDRQAENDFRHIDSRPDSPEEHAALEAAARDVAEACAATSGPLLGHMTTTDAARDADRFRAALGLEQINWLGLSYGSLLGQVYADLFPGNLRAIVIDGVVDPGKTLEELLVDQATSFAAAIDRGVERCRGTGACSVADPLARLDTIRERVETAPIPVGSRELGPSEVSIAMIAAGYSDAAMRDFTQGLSSPDESVAARALLALSDQYTSAASFGTYLGVECTDGPRPSTPEEHRAAAARAEEVVPLLGAPVLNELLPCAFWPVPPGPAPRAIVARGSPPVLVIGTTGDTATPYSYAQTVSRNLAHATLLTLEGEGHTATFSSRCVFGYVRRYLTDLDLPREGTRCT